MNGLCFTAYRRESCAAQGAGMPSAYIFQVRPDCLISSAMERTSAVQDFGLQSLVIPALVPLVRAR